MKIRKAHIFQLKPGAAEEYIRRHNPIWPELQQALREVGASNYSIFLDEASGRLFAYLECESEERLQTIASTDVCQRWWREMAELMETNPDFSPQALDLREVFHLD